MKNKIKIVVHIVVVLFGINLCSAMEDVGIFNGWHELPEIFRAPLLTKTIEFFLQGKIEVFDGICGNNQCHLNALKVVTLANDKNFVKSLRVLKLDTFNLNDLDEAQQDKLLFLACNFLINKALPDDDKNRSIALCNVGIDVTKNFLNKQTGSIKRTITSFLLEEFKQITGSSNSDIEHFPKTEKKNHSLTVIPKCLGIKAFITCARENDIWSVLVCKSKKDSSLMSCAIRPDHTDFVSLAQVPDDTAVVVIEGSCDGTFEPLFNSFIPEQMHHANAANFMMHDTVQVHWLTSVAGTKELFDCAGWFKFSKDWGFSSENQSTLVIKHMFPSTKQNIVNRLKQNKRFIDFSCEDLLSWLKKKG